MNNGTKDDKGKCKNFKHLPIGLLAALNDKPQINPLIHLLDFINEMQNGNNVFDSIVLCVREIIKQDRDPYTLYVGAANVMKFGADKYGDKNYIMVDINRYFEAIRRHIIDIIANDDIYHLDKETSERHLSHVLANVFIIADILGGCL